MVLSARNKGDHMGLDMKDKKRSAGRLPGDTKRPAKKGRGKLLDEYTVTLGYNRDYLAPILSNGGKTLYIRAEGKTVTIIAATAPHEGRKARKTASTLAEIRPLRPIPPPHRG